MPVLTYSASIEPWGSASTIWTAGAVRPKNRDMPVSVPPVPTPHTTASSRCCICSQISGAVVSSCAWGLAWLVNWLM